MVKAILLAQVEGEYRVAITAKAGQLTSKYLRDREDAVSVLTGWRYSGQAFTFYARAVAYARELQERNGGISIYEIEWKFGSIRATELA